MMVLVGYAYMTTVAKDVAPRPDWVRVWRCDGCDGVVMSEQEPTRCLSCWRYQRLSERLALVEPL